MEPYATAQQVWPPAWCSRASGRWSCCCRGSARPTVPPRIRLAFALLLALVPGPDRRRRPCRRCPATVGGHGGAALIKELLIGLMIGAMLRMFLASLAVAGEIVSMQTTLAFAQTANPGQAQPATALATFLTPDGRHADLRHRPAPPVHRGHRQVLRACSPRPRRCRSTTPASWPCRPCRRAFALGIQLAAPVIVFSLVFNIATGLVGRVMPQFQIFFVATPLSVLLGLSIFALSLGVIGMVWVDRYRDSPQRVHLGASGWPKKTTPPPRQKSRHPGNWRTRGSKGDVAKSTDLPAVAVVRRRGRRAGHRPAAGCRSDLMAALTALRRPPRAPSSCTAAAASRSCARPPWPRPPALLVVLLRGGHGRRGRQPGPARLPVDARTSSKPDLNKLSPMAGFKRMFGLDGLVQFLKSLVKVVVDRRVAWMVLKPRAAELAASCRPWTRRPSCRCAVAVADGAGVRRCAGLLGVDRRRSTGSGSATASCSGCG